MVDNTTLNPFLCEGPVPSDRFIGREAEINTILDLIAHSERGSSAIAGEKGVGKTSLLNYISASEVLKKWNLSPEWCTFVKIDCQTITSPMEMTFWSKVFHTMECSLFDEELKRECERLRTAALFTGFDLGQLFDKLAQANKLVVLLLDEFQWVMDHVNPEKPDLLSAMRYLINRPLQGLSIVVTTLDPLYALCSGMNFSGGSPFPTSFVSIPLKPFSWDEANELIDRALIGTKVKFTEEDRKHIYETSKGHPARLQRACFGLFERYTKRAGTG